MMTRRTMLGAAAAGTAAGAAAAAGPATAATPSVLPDELFVHHVYFWLKEPANPQAREALIAGLHKLRTCPDILWSHIGLPAPSERDVVEDGYSVSWLAFFADKAAEDRYQVDPIHLRFVQHCAAIWDRVIVYDTEHAPA